MSDMLDACIKEKLVNKSDIYNLIEKPDLNTKIATVITKSELNAKQDKIVNRHKFNSSNFQGKLFFL